MPARLDPTTRFALSVVSSLRFAIVPSDALVHVERGLMHDACQTECPARRIARNPRPQKQLRATEVFCFFVIGEHLLPPCPNANRTVRIRTAACHSLLRVSEFGHPGFEHPKRPTLFTTESRTEHVRSGGSESLFQAKFESAR